MLLLWLYGDKLLRIQIFLFAFMFKQNLCNFYINKNFFICSKHQIQSGKSVGQSKSIYKLKIENYVNRYAVSSKNLKILLKSHLMKLMFLRIICVIISLPCHRRCLRRALAISQLYQAMLSFTQHVILQSLAARRT